MTIGANAISVGANWTGGNVGSGQVFKGHSDSNPDQTCAASANILDAFVETSCVPSASGGDATQKRTLQLSNGQMLWDFSGNA